MSWWFYTKMRTELQAQDEPFELTYLIQHKDSWQQTHAELGSKGTDPIQIHIWHQRTTCLKLLLLISIAWNMYWVYSLVCAGMQDTYLNPGIAILILGADHRNTEGFYRGSGLAFCIEMPIEQWRQAAFVDIGSVSSRGCPLNSVCKPSGTQSSVPKKSETFAPSPSRARWCFPVNLFIVRFQFGALGLRGRWSPGTGCRASRHFEYLGRVDGVKWNDLKLGKVYRNRRAWAWVQ